MIANGNTPWSMHRAAMKSWTLQSTDEASLNALLGRTCLRSCAISLLILIIHIFLVTQHKVYCNLLNTMDVWN